MRIDNWGIGGILELPDHLFGRRFLVSCTVQGGAAAAAWDISEIAFPEMTIVWEVTISSDSFAADVGSIRVTIGDQLPTSIAMMTALEPFLQGLGAQGPGPRVITVSRHGELAWRQLKFPIRTAGRKLVLEVTGAAEKTPVVTVGVVVSSVPKEIPEWMCSAKDR